MDRELFILETSKLNINLTDEMLKKIEKYYKLLIEWNEKINLTAITDKNEVYLKHFYDSLTLCKVINLNEIDSLCDIGTGAGFPGVVLKICFPHLKLTLVDALNKRINFLRLVCDELELTNVECIHARAEEYALKNREKFDVVTARAVAALPILLEYSIPLVKNSKYFIALKGIENINESKNALNVLNCNILQEEKFLLPIEGSNRTIIKVQKLGNTLGKYPRRFSEIKKNPL